MNTEQKAVIREITPKEALAILEKNEGNRNLRRTRIEMYARDMRAGKWKFNGDAIRFNGGEKLLDGQHRLHACVEAGKPFTTLVVHGVTQDAHKTIDVGLGRSLADELKWAGHTNVSELAAVLALLKSYDDQTMQQSPAHSRAELSSYLTKNPLVADSVSNVASSAKKVGVRATALAATHFLIAREHGKALADEFVERVFSGTDYVEGDPCLALRNYALNAASNRLFRPSTTEWFAYIIKAANAWLLGRPVKHLRWRRVGHQREAFPALITADELGDA